MYYRQLRTGLDNYTLIPDTDNFEKYLLNRQQDYYTSVYKYTEEQYKQFQITKSIKGVKNVFSDWLVFDFDNEKLELAQQDAQELCQRLVDAGIDEANLYISYSGSKGFHVEIPIKEHLSPKEHKAIAKEIATGLNTFDSKVYDHARPFRILGSINKKSGLYKTLLSPEEILTFTIPQIKDKSKVFSGLKQEVKHTPLPKNILNLKDRYTEEEIKVTPIQQEIEIDWSNKPKFLSNCRYALKQGYFEAGERNNALLCLAATYKNLNFDRDDTYRLLKSAADKQAKRLGIDRYPDEEVWDNILLQVYNPEWKGGQFSCRDKLSWLHEYCQTLDDHKCEHKVTDNLVNANQVLDLFKTYTEKYEQNILFTGIKDLDQKVKFMVGTSNGILAPPGVGKSSLALQILEHNSMSDIPCLFYSYDMFHSALYMRMLQKQLQMNQDQIYKLFKDDYPRLSDSINKMNDKFKNVQFCFKSGQTIDELEETILEAEEKTGKKIKLVIVDYNELVLTDIADPTSSSALVAQRLRQIANDREVCIITLLQPAKQFCSPADEITNFNSVKGSSSIVQSLTLLLGCSRPGFNPLKPDDDRYFNITCLKNRNGPLFTLDLAWDGLMGKIDHLEDNDYYTLQKIREAKTQQKDGENWN